MTDGNPAAVNPAILVVDDDAAFLRGVGRVLRMDGYEGVTLCEDPRKVAALLERQGFGTVLLDLNMPGVSGEELLGHILRQAPRTAVVMITATNDADTAIRCVKAGAYDYLVKPVDSDRLSQTVRGALRHHGVVAVDDTGQQGARESCLRRAEVFSGIVTQSPAMLTLFNYIESVAPSMESVLIQGETGTGKGLLSKAIHDASGRSGPLVSVNVAGLDAEAFSDTLFGHRKGAFTGAGTARDGLIETAAGGTLFLDEIGCMQRDIQIKLLRLLEEREYFPLGSDTPRKSTCRVVAATAVDLRQAIRSGAFRSDLYYRLHTYLAHIPPLRERVGDIPLLLDRFLGDAAASLSKPKPTVPPELFAHLAGYGFPGNVRELRAMAFEAVSAHSHGVLSMRTFLARIDWAIAADRGTEDACGSAAPVTFGVELPTLDETARLLMDEALDRTQGNQKAAAKLVGVSRRTIGRHRQTGQATGAGNPTPHL